MSVDVMPKATRDHSQRGGMVATQESASYAARAERPSKGIHMNFRILLSIALVVALPNCLVSAKTEESDTVATTSDVSVEGETPPLDGALALAWTIEQTKDPAQCEQSHFKTVEVLVTAADGSPAGQFQGSCSSFGIAIGLEPGTYSADALLVDTTFHDRNSVHLATFEIHSAERLSVPIDFSAAVLAVR
jgi:hypothetical protein